MQTELSGCATEARAARRSCHHDAGPAMWAQMRGVLGREGAGTSSMEGSVKSFVCSSSCHNRCPTQTIEEYVGTTVSLCSCYCRVVAYAVRPRSHAVGTAPLVLGCMIATFMSQSTHQKIQMRASEPAMADSLLNSAR